MNILVTGGGGFIGSHVCAKLLSEGHSVGIIDDLNDFYDPEIKRANLERMLGAANFVHGDIRSEEDVERAFQETAPEIVIHLAARAGVRPSIQEPKLYIETNISGTFHILEASRKGGVEKVVFGSSSSVYGVNRKVPFAEDDLIQSTISPYAMTKLAAEQLCSNYVHLYGLSCICLRFFTVYGPGQRPDLAIHKFTERIHRGIPIEMYGDGSTARDYTYVDDIVDGVMASIQFQKSKFEIFNLGESQTVRLRDLIELISVALGKEALVKQLEEQPGDVPLTFADISKAQDLLGYRPKTKISEGVPRFVDWYLANS